MDLSQLGLLSGQTNSGDQRADDLLTKISDLLQQYLAMGGGTPVAKQAQALSDAIDQHMSGSSTLDMQGGAGAEGTSAEESAETPADETKERQAGEVDQDDPGYTGGGFSGAHKGAAAFLKSKNKKGKVKAA